MSDELVEFQYNEIKIYKNEVYIFQKRKEVKQNEIKDFMCGVSPNHETIE